MHFPDPIIRQMVIGDHATSTEGDPRKNDLHGVLQAVYVPHDSVFPLALPELSLYVLMSEGRGTGEVRVVIVSEESRRIELMTHAFPVLFSGNPLTRRAFVFELNGGELPAPGLYWIGLWYNGTLLHEIPLEVLLDDLTEPTA